MRTSLRVPGGLFIGALLLAMRHSPVSTDVLSWRSSALSDNFSLPVPRKGQQESYWCWAASAQMILDYLDRPKKVTQCAVADKQKEFSRENCCQHRSACNQPSLPEFGAYGYKADATSNAPLSWAEVKTQIHDRKQPFAFSWHDGGDGTAHMMVARGYKTEGTHHLVCINDPQYGTHYCIPYSQYVHGPKKNGLHYNDYYNFAKQP